MSSITTQVLVNSIFKTISIKLIGLEKISDSEKIGLDRIEQKIVDHFSSTENDALTECVELSIEIEFNDTSCKA